MSGQADAQKGPKAAAEATNVGAMTAKQMEIIAAVNRLTRAIKVTSDVDAIPWAKNDLAAEKRINLKHNDDPVVIKSEIQPLSANASTIWAVIKPHDMISIKVDRQQLSDVKEFTFLIRYFAVDDPDMDAAAAKKT